MTGPDARPARLYPPSADLLDAFARELIAAEQARLPDLTRCCILLPSPGGADRVARRLAHHAGRGLLGPQVRTLAAFAQAHAGGAPAYSALECQLLLTESLRRHRGLFPGQDHLRVAEALFELFEELTLEQVDPGADEAAFTSRLARGYGSGESEWLSREARIVQTLWQAFTTDTEGRSPARVHLRDLAAAFAATDLVHLVGFDALTRAEGQLVSQAVREGRAEMWLQGRTAGHDGAALSAFVEQLGIKLAERFGTPVSQLLDRAFDLDSRIRGNDGIRGNDIPAKAGIQNFRIAEAGGPEHEARCVDLAVREALLAGARDIAVITPDRRLARRLRALLERAGVPLQDHGGWALSTSSAAAALNSWLDCLETDFQFRPLLDLLKSSFMAAPAEALTHLERDLVYRDGIEGGLATLSAASKQDALKELLRRVHSAAFALPEEPARWDGRRWTDALLGGLRRLGLLDALRADDAGERLAQLLERIDATCKRLNLPMSWPEFRELLDRAIERETFAPSARGPVRLLTLEQAQGLSCEVLVLAGATRDKLPGSPAARPFFNESVRLELGLPGWQSRRALALARLRRVLEAAPQVLVTFAAENEEEPAQASPWIEAIEFAAGASLRETSLPARAGSAEVEVAQAAPEPAVPRSAPAPAVTATMLPEMLSASAHQALIDCPYRFYARSLLRLRAESAPDEDPDRSDYGQHVHLILQAFTEAVPKHPELPPPFAAAVTPANRAAAQTRLEEIAAAVFAPELRTRALALRWQAEFRAAIPKLLDWFVKRPKLASVRSEVDLQQPFEGLTLGGRADRLEILAGGERTIVDYKTGKLPKKDDLAAGEQVQLLHYALLDPQVSSVEYLPVREDTQPLALSEELPELREATRARLAAALASIRGGSTLIAHGDEATCEYCDFSGVCRREDWHG